MQLSRLNFTIFLAMQLFLLSLVAVSLFCQVSASPTDPWWNTDWQYRMPVTVTSTQSLTDYAVLITMDTQPLIPSKMSSDGSDMRFVDSLGTELSYWIETPTINTPSTRIWVKLPSVTIGDTMIWMYYGNPSASPASDGDATFEFFDDDWSQFAPGAGNPVHTAGQPWWEATVSYPVVFEDTSFLDRPRFHMLYDGHNVIGHAKGYAWSSDLNTWVEYDEGEPHPPNPNPIMGVGYTGNAICAWGDVMKVGGTYYMYYSRGPGTIYYAESTNLTTWYNLQPITGGSFGTGAAILKEGDGITPIVVDEKFWMVYFPSGSPGSMYLASTNATGDLLEWDPWSGNPLLAPTPGGWDQSGLWTPSFARLNNKYYIYYQGNGPAGWETGFASADAYDGVGAPIRPDVATWSKSDPDVDGNPDPVITHGPPGSWDSSYCIDPMIREFDGTYYVFYTGNSANGYAYSDNPEGPWTKFGEGPVPTVWSVVAGTPAVSDGILSLGKATGIKSTSTYLYHAVGYRANFSSGEALSWGGFIDGSTNDRTMVGTLRTDSNMYLRNFVLPSGAESTAVLSGALLGDFHVYEVLWKAGNSTAIVDHGASTATLTVQVPSTTLPVTFYNYEVDDPVQVDWVFVRKYGDPEPTAVVGTEETRECTIESCDSTGTEKDIFNPDENVYVNGSGYSPDTDYDLYIVSDIDDWTLVIDIPADVRGAPTTVHSNSTGHIPPTIVWGSPTPGKYDIVVDVNGNSDYDEGVDALDDLDVNGGGFFVITEYLLGTILVLVVCFAAFGAFWRKKHKKQARAFLHVTTLHFTKIWKRLR